MKFRDRVLFLGLAIVDRLFGTHWVQRELERRRNLLTEHQTRVANIQREIDYLQVQLETLHLQLCLLYLRHRYMAGLENWLHFESGGSDEPGLDILIEHLVKPRLAAIEMHETAPDHHVYHLRPDWGAIAAAIGDAANVLEPETLAWLHQRIANQSRSMA
jgi:hypothetical protein